MASNTSSWYSISGHSARKYRAYVNAYVQSQNDTTATIYVEGCCQAYYMSSYGCRVRVYINGSQVDTDTAAIMNSSGTAGNWAWASGTLIISKSSSSKSITCKCTVSGETVSGCGGVNGGSPSTSVSVPVSAITYYAPNAPTGFNSAYESDNKNRLYWTAPTTSTTKPVSAILIERSVDGGEWSQIASVGGSATSYNDTSTSADHSYQYRIRSQNSAGYSAYVESQITYNTPAAPTKVTAARLSETTVSITLENTARTAQYLQLQRSTDAATWETVAEVSGTPVTETTDTPEGGTFYYRARNGRDSQDGGFLWSDWSAASNAVVTICPPAEPTLVSPASGKVVSKADGTVTFAWTHNSVDGSAQIAAILRYSVDAGTNWTEVAIEGNAAFYTIENNFDVNAQVTWSMCTKGADESYGEWSDNRVFYVYQQPSVAFAQPADSFTVENMPIAVELQYDDASGSLANATLSVSDGYRAVYTRNMGTETTCEIQATDWIPDDGVTYTLSVTVRSSSSLTNTATRDVAVSFTPPQPADLYIENDEDTGYATIVVTVEDLEEYEAPTYITVYRVHNGERVLLGEDLQAGAGLVDKYAPLNSDYQYIAVTHAESGAINSQVYPNKVRSIKWFLYHDEVLASAVYNPESDIKLSRPSKTQVHYAGRRWPVSYDGYNVSDERSLSASLFTYREMEAFRKLMYSGGRCVFKSYDGDVFHADVDVALKPDYTTPNLYGTVTLNIVRIDGGDL